MCVADSAMCNAILLSVNDNVLEYDEQNSPLYRMYQRATARIIHVME
jgi:hypothetical protein